MKMTLTVFAALFVVVLASACDPGFDDSRKITDMRIIGVATNPPEMVVPAPYATLFASLMAFEATYKIPGDLTTELKLLVESPEAPEAPITYSVVACAVGGDFYCDPDFEQAEVASGQLLPGETTLTVTIPLKVAEDAIRADDFKGIFGGVVWLRGDISDGTYTDSFMKAYTILPDYGFDRQANQNPTFEGFLVGDKDEEVPMEFNDEGRLEVASGEKIRILPTFPEEDREDYIVVDFEGQAVDQTEDLSVSFYSSCGLFNSGKKTEEVFFFFEDAKDKEDQNLSSEWSAPAVPESCTMWFVVDDSRGGVSWDKIEVDVK